MRTRTVTKSAVIVLAALGLIVGGAGAAAAKDDTPGHIRNGKFVPGCSATELTMNWSSGTSLESVTCPKCKAQNSPTAKFCAECGATLSPETK